MLTRGTAPILLAAIFKPPCSRSFSLLGPAVGVQFDASGDGDRAYTFRSAPGNCRSPSTTGATTHTSAFTDMAKKRSWVKKKEERSRSFAKRGRVGGWGDYGPDGAGQPKCSNRAALTAGTSALDGTAPPGEAPSTAEQQQQQAQGREQKNQSRKVYEVHPGSYAGELAGILSEERRCVLRERLEQDDKSAQDRTASPKEDPAAGSGESGVASDVSKKKVALLISYWGSNYQGLQINEGARTVEAELELALYLAGAVSKDNFGNLRKVSWSRSGRTDKGVHAAAQARGIISLKMTYPNDGEKETIEAINRHLPEDIRVVDIKRAPKSFDARTRCSGRRYEYIMPTFVLAPKEHVRNLFDEAIAWEISKSGGGDGPAEAPLVDGADGTSVVPEQRSQETPQALPEPAPPRELEVEAKAVAVPPIHDKAPPSPPRGVEVTGAKGGSSDHQHYAYDDEGDENAEGDQDEEEVDDVTGRLETVELSSPAVVERVADRLQGYRLSADTMSVLREVLKVYVGTRNYHNYTNHKKATDPSCNRLVTSFTAGDPFEEGGREWIRLTVEGQSFILHQIRKMVAATVDRVRGQSSQEDLMLTFKIEKMNLGTAPSEGLYLERPLYVIHNKHMKQQGAQDRALEWETGDSADALENFKRKKIHAGILAKEEVDHDFVAWLDRLTRYPCNY
ncbi:unnamed protein product [Ascophyllum nodosum]